MKFKPTHVALAVISMSPLVGCGTTDIHGTGSASKQEEPAPKEADAQGESVTFDETVTPPQAYYDALFDDAVRNAGKNLALIDAPQILWLNFDGATVAKGFGRGQSFIPCNANATIPAPSLSPADKSQIVALVQQYYDAAGARIVVTPGKPAAGDFTAMHIGGAYRDLGCVGGTGVLGIAPLDQGNANRNDVGFAFTPSGASARLIAETIAHEAGHSFGLDHVSTATDLMFASAGANITGFGISNVVGSNKIQNGPAILQQVLGVATGGGTVVVPPANPQAPVTPLPAVVPGLPNLPTNLANLPGLGQLGNLGQLLPGLPTGSVLDITQLVPQLTTLLPAAGGLAGLPGLDHILTVVGMASQAGSVPGGLGGLPIDPALAAAILGGGAGGIPLDLGALAALGGFGDITMAISALQGILGGTGGLGGLGGIIGGVTGGIPGSAAPTIPSLGALPDLSQLLGLASGIPDLSTLITSFMGSTQLVNSNFTGANQNALLSLLKVAYAQQYQTLVRSPTP